MAESWVGYTGLHPCGCAEGEVPVNCGFLWSFEEFRGQPKISWFFKIREHHNFPIRVVPFLDTAMICWVVPFLGTWYMIIPEISHRGTTKFRQCFDIGFCQFLINDSYPSFPEMCVLCAFSLKLILQLFIWLVSISQSGGPLSYLCWLVASSNPINISP